MEHIENLKRGDFITITRGPMHDPPDPYGLKSGLDCKIEDRSWVGIPLRVVQVYPPFILAARAQIEKLDITNKLTFEAGRSARDFMGMFFDPPPKNAVVLDTRQVKVQRIAFAEEDTCGSNGSAPMKSSTSDYPWDLEIDATGPSSSDSTPGSGL